MVPNNDKHVYISTTDNYMGHVVQKNCKIKTAVYMEVIISHLYFNNNFRFAAKHVINLTYISRSAGRELMEAKANRACF